MRRDDKSDRWALDEATWDFDAFERCLTAIPPMVSYIAVQDRCVPPDFAIRFENMADDFLRCTQVLGTAPSMGTLPYVNGSSAPALAQRALSDPKAQRLVREKFASDFDFFGYAEV